MINELQVISQLVKRLGRLEVMRCVSPAVGNQERPSRDGRGGLVPGNHWRIPGNTAVESELNHMRAFTR